jgi:hypothetical protein
MKITMRIMGEVATFNTDNGTWKHKVPQVKKTLDVLAEKQIGRVSQPHHVEDVVYWVHRLYPNAELLQVTDAPGPAATGKFNVN